MTVAWVGVALHLALALQAGDQGRHRLGGDGQTAGQLRSGQTWPVWEAIAERDLVVFMHPHGVKDPWYLDYGLWNSIGQTVEEARALSSMIYEGLLDHLPTLKIVVSHGGGYLPHYCGRLDRNVHNMPHSARNITRLPSEYLRDLYYDTCVYDPEVLAALVGRVGANRIVLGSDYPVGDPDPVGFIERCPG
ncbi:amidohydrolase family protein, partial [Streptomyces sp. NPDC006386]